MRLEKVAFVQRLALSSLCALFLWLAPLPGQAQSESDIQIVRGLGAILRGDQAEARQSAIESSLRQALEQTVARLLEADASVSHFRTLKAQIYGRAPRYVRSYRVLWEYPDLQQQVYRVELEVEVATDAVMRVISRLGLIRADHGPRRASPRTF